MMQPDPKIFFKTFLELGCTNFCSLLAFDSWVMSYLLDDRHSEHFSEEYPIIFKNKFLKNNGKKYYYTNAINIALKNHQIKAVQVLISYIVKYQNNYVSSYLFTNNLPILIEKGIPVSSLIQSEIFNVQFDFDSWPGAHVDDKYCIRAYNGNFFDLREQYRKIFYDFEEMGDANNYKG